MYRFDLYVLDRGSIISNTNTASSLILSNSVPIYLSICVCLSADFRRRKRLQRSGTWLLPGVVHLSYSQTAGVRNIFPSALCYML